MKNTNYTLSKSILIVLFALFSSAVVNAQKVKIKKGIAYVDGKEYLKPSKCGLFQSECSISNLKGEEIIYIKSLENPRATGSYFQVTFLGMDTKIEIQKTMKPFIKLLYTHNVVDENGALVEEKVKLLYEKYGNEISFKY